MKQTKKIICIALCILTVVTIFAACGKKSEPTEEEILTTVETTIKEPITIEEPGKQTEKETTKRKNLQPRRLKQQLLSRTLRLQPLRNSKLLLKSRNLQPRNRLSLQLLKSRNRQQARKRKQLLKSRKQQSLLRQSRKHIPAEVKIITVQPRKSIPL